MPKAGEFVHTEWDHGNAEFDLNLRHCPYYQGTGMCIQVDRCTYAMGNPEPMCQTCEPLEGWPTLDVPHVRRAWPPFHRRTQLPRGRR